MDVQHAIVELALGNLAIADGVLPGSVLDLFVIALGVAFAAIFGRVQPMVFGETSARRLPHPPALLPVFAHLAIVLVLGLYVPPYLAQWYRAAAQLIGGQ